jgi:hypothetical protein
MVYVQNDLISFSSSSYFEVKDNKRPLLRVLFAVGNVEPVRHFGACLTGVAKSLLQLQKTLASGIAIWPAPKYNIAQTHIYHPFANTFLPIFRVQFIDERRR